MGNFLSCFAKKALKESPMDPFNNFDESTQDLILQHFCGPEILIMSEVSLNWYKTLGGSGTAMKKITLKVVDSDKDWKKKAAILLSSRNYQNMFLNSQKKLQIIETYASSLVELTITNFDVRAEELELPRLKKLVIDGNVMVSGLLGYWVLLQISRNFNSAPFEFQLSSS